MKRQDLEGLAFRQVLLGATAQIPGRKGLGLSGTEEQKERRGARAVSGSSVQSQVDLVKEESLGQGGATNPATSPPDNQLFMSLKFFVHTDNARMNLTNAN
ncbi:hypothetical protein H920_15580 [Fukomys damarensis]|uniref:Uncharacterized protein n=1 Tax=Fukomys damarensis TaxID=885580 RepID=A0A091CXQ2_FUKDA|nr:hypothetical protein H920_15580 [Fukomys damarensis]